jgi:hypothetical protein
MIVFFLPLPEPTGTPKNIAEIDRIMALRRKVMEDYLQFKTQSGVWQGLFTKPRPEAKTMEEKAALQKQMTFEDVGKYLDETGYHNGRLDFFEAWAPASDFYTHVAKRLLSMRTTGSFSVERAAKPMKNNAMIKTRNSLKKDKGLVLLRAGLNMRVLYRVKKIVIESAVNSDSSSEIGGEVYDRAWE